MANYIRYKTLTGEIVSTGVCPASMIPAQARPGLTVIEGTANDLTQYINPVTEELISKTILPSSVNKLAIDADGIDACVISNLPDPTFIIIHGEGQWEVTDGSFEFTIDTIGDYKIECHSPLYLDVEYIINAS